MNKKLHKQNLIIAIAIFIVIICFLLSALSKRDEAPESIKLELQKTREELADLKYHHAEEVETLKGILENLEEENETK